MKRTLAALVLSATALVLGGCSSSNSGSSNSTQTAELGATQTVTGDGWAAEVTVSDLIVREMDYYGDIKPERQYRAKVSVKSTGGETPITSTSFSAVAADGTAMTISVGGESDDIDASGDVPTGYERSGMVTWTGDPGITIREISFAPEGMSPAAVWTVSAAPASAAPSRMPNHDEIVARTSTPLQTKTSATTAVPTTSKTKTPTGQALYDETCTGAKEFFDGLRQLSGDTWDAKATADQFMDMIMHPENYPEMTPSETAENKDWDDLSKADQEQIRKAVNAAADGEC